MIRRFFNKSRSKKIGGSHILGKLPENSINDYANPHFKMAAIMADIVHDHDSFRGLMTELIHCKISPHIGDIYHYSLICDMINTYNRFIEALKTTAQARSLLNKYRTVPAFNLQNIVNLKITDISPVPLAPGTPAAIPQPVAADEKKNGTSTINGYFTNILGFLKPRTKVETQFKKYFTENLKMYRIQGGKLLFSKPINDMIRKYKEICYELFGTDNPIWFAVVADANIGFVCKLFKQILLLGIGDVPYNITDIQNFCKARKIAVLYFIITPARKGDSANNMTFIPCLTLFRRVVTHILTSDAAGHPIFNPITSVDYSARPINFHTTHNHPNRDPTSETNKDDIGATGLFNENGIFMSINPFSDHIYRIYIQKRHDAPYTYEEKTGGCNFKYVIRKRDNTPIKTALDPDSDSDEEKYEDAAAAAADDVDAAADDEDEDEPPAILENKPQHSTGLFGFILPFFDSLFGYSSASSSSAAAASSSSFSSSSAAAAAADDDDAAAAADDEENEEDEVPYKPQKKKLKKQQKGGAMVQSYEINFGLHNLNNGSSAYRRTGPSVTKLQFYYLKLLLKGYKPDNTINLNSNIVKAISKLNEDDNYYDADAKYDIETSINMLDYEGTSIMPHIKDVHTDIKYVLGTKTPDADDSRAKLLYTKIKSTNLINIDGFNQLDQTIFIDTKFKHDYDQIIEGFILDKTYRFGSKIVFTSEDIICASTSANMGNKTIRYTRSDIIEIYNGLGPGNESKKRKKKSKSNNDESNNNQSGGAINDIYNIDEDEINEEMYVYGLNAVCYLDAYKKKYSKINPNDYLHNDVLHQFYDDFCENNAYHKSIKEINEIDIQYERGNKFIFLNIMQKLYRKKNINYLKNLIRLANIYNRHYNQPIIDYKQYIAPKQVNTVAMTKLHKLQTNNRKQNGVKPLSKHRKQSKTHRRQRPRRTHVPTGRPRTRKQKTRTHTKGQTAMHTKGQTRKTRQPRTRIRTGTRKTNRVVGFV